ncbi:hypothetical protein SLEP1_g49458 [Rubroshorea leprosula]|uniref:Uncharacterized protein n=1 Tax=Rubroshorea leprosula TaxID=152421 RepID=A0AAV5LZC5_9ROSI|nr:hypothetical protein SLEP1_g49458 [Rubroshorea leprosula]
MVNTRSVRAGNSSQPLGRGQPPNSLPPQLPPQIPNMFPPVDHAKEGDENQPHNSAHNSTSTANQDVVAAQLTAMQQQFGVFQLVLAQLLAWNNPSDPLINLLNPAPQPLAPQQNPELVQHALALSESQGQSHIAPAQQPLPNDVTRRLGSLENLPPRSISSYTEIASAFATKFSSRRLIRKITSELMRVKQRDEESLKNYMSRFNDAVLEVNSFTQVVGITVVISEIQAMVSQSHLCMKFSTPMGISTLRGNQGVARHYYLTLVTRPHKNKDQPVENPSPKIHDNQQVMGVEILDNQPENETRAALGEDIEEIQIDEDDPNRKTQIGTRLNPKERAELITFLRANKDKPVAQKQCLFGGERLKVIKEEVEKLLQAGFVRRVDYCEWVANPVLMKKANGKWRMCINYTNLNQACPKDCYPIPNIDKLVEAASGNERLSLLDAYYGYHLVPMAPEDEEKTSFYAGDEIYYYVMMPFGLKNVSATYQKMVTIVFRAQLGRNLEIYVDDIVVKSLKAEDHLTDLEETFNNLKKNRMRLNPAKCIFGVELGKFLSFMVSKRGIKVNPEKIKAVAEMEPSKSPHLLIKANDGEILYLYLCISDEAISSVLVREEEKQHKQVYYTSSVLHGAKIRYSIAEKAALAVVTSARKLRPYFQSHPIIANDGEILYLYLCISDEAISSVLVREEGKQHKQETETIFPITPNHSSHGSAPQTNLAEAKMIKWAVELGEFEITFQQRSTIRAQALADFIVECTSSHSSSQFELDSWILYVDGASSNKGSGASAILLGPDGYRSEHALKFNFDATNNMAEYEALLLGLQLAVEQKVAAIQIYSDSQLVVNQVNSVYEVVDPVMMKLVIVEILDELSFIKPKMMKINTDPDTPSWTDPIISFLRDGTVPADKQEEMRLRKKASRYTLVNEVLYKRSFSLPLLHCLNPYEAEYALREVHEGVYGSHIGARTLAHKVLGQGYYWPNMYKDVTQFVQKCQKCPFMKGVEGVTHLILGVDYFTKWVEARPLSSLTFKKVEDFVFSSIICRYGIPNQNVADNGTQFNCSSFRDFYSSYGIKLQFTSVYHPESNGMVESVNKAYRTTSRTATSETPYHLAFGTKAVIPIEIRVPSFRVTHFDEGRNGQLLRENLDLLDEVREETRLRTLVYNQKIANFYNKRVRPQTFKVGGLVLRKAGLIGFET